MTDINWSMSRKITDGNFGSFEVSHFITDTVRPEETREEANKRVFTEVEENIGKAIEFKLNQIRRSQQ